MSRLHIRRTLAPHVAALFVIAPLAVAMVAAPASASGTTRWVDKDGHAGPSGCSGSATAKTTIQKAVNASAANDTIKVCPGTYVEKVTISGARTGLTLQSTTNHAAIIKAPDDATFNTIVLVKVTSVSGVTIKGFSIQPLRAGSHSYCDDGDGIDVTNSKTVTITKNEIKPSGSGPFCGVFTGINATGGTTGTISSNTVTDYRENGIHLGGTGTNVTVSGNIVTFAQVGLNTAGGAAILVDSSAKGAISSNSINGPAAGSGNPPQPAAGVQLDGSASGVNVSNNTIARMAADIDLVQATGGSVTGNTMTGGQAGLDMGTAVGVTVSGNVSHGATVAGFSILNPAKNNNVHDNDFRTDKNFNLADCKGQSSQVVSAGSGNAFDNNQGNSSNPAALCEGAVPR
jgi:parallel beta-helix repeat protein